MKLKELLNSTVCETVFGDEEINVESISLDSRTAAKESVFVCIKGSSYDGHDYIKSAVENGASAVVIQSDYDITDIEGYIKENNITLVKTDSTEKAASHMAAAYYGNPAKRLITIAITGTKGKTTTSFMIKSILDSAGIKTGIIGTIGILNGDELTYCENTTPDALVINKALFQMAESGCRAVVMEVSSQAFKRHRTEGIIFDYGVFTNLTRDHISEIEHHDFEEYRECKKRLFDVSRKGIVNLDDKASLYMMKNRDCEYITYGYREEALRCVKSEFALEDNRPVTEFELDGLVKYRAKTFMPGRFNVYNSMAAIAVCADMGVDKKYFSAIETVVVPGRVQSVVADANLQVIVDYAHNEASLESMLTACREHKPKRLVCVFGCGGNRSRDRRIGMGKVSGRLADFTIITEDNSRNEPLDNILADIKIGLAHTDGFYLELPDRRTAIRFAILRSKPGDLVVIAGKGHEEFQEIDGKKLHFSDVETALEAYKEYNSDNKKL